MLTLINIFANKFSEFISTFSFVGIRDQKKFQPDSLWFSVAGTRPASLTLKVQANVQQWRLVV